MSQANQKRIVAVKNVQLFTFTIGNVKQLSFQSTFESAEKLSGSTFIRQ